MSLGLCCQFLEEKKKRNGTTIYKNIINEKSLQLGAYKNGKYTRTKILETYRNNVEEHLRIFPKLIEGRFKSFRLSSSLFPLFDFCGDIAKGDECIRSRLAILGQNFKEHGIRVTTHPGQFTSLTSDKTEVVENSIKELEYHAWIFDSMSLDHTPYYAINIHGGKANKSDQLIDVINSLPTNVKKRLTLENDEKCYNIKQLENISKYTGTPIVFDSHHYTFNTGDIDIDTAVNISNSSWGNIKPLHHLSNTEVGMENGNYTERRTHSKMIRYVPEQQLKLVREDLIDLDVEAKNKNLAILQMRKDFNVEL